MHHRAEGRDGQRETEYKKELNEAFRIQKEIQKLRGDVVPIVMGIFFRCDVAFLSEGVSVCPYVRMLRLFSERPLGGRIEYQVSGLVFVRLVQGA